MSKRIFTLVTGIIFGILAVMGASPYVTESDISYTAKEDSLSKSRLKLDIHHHQDAKDLPVIVWFHGGGLTGGEKFIPGELMDHGYVIVAPNYRLIPDVTVTEWMEDAAEACPWVLRKMDKY